MSSNGMVKSLTYQKIVRRWLDLNLHRCRCFGMAIVPMVFFFMWKWKKMGLIRSVENVRQI